MGLGEMLIGVFTLSPSKIAKGFNDAKDAVFHGAMDLAGSFKKGYDEGMEGFAEDHKEKNESLIPKKLGKPQKLVGEKIAEPKTKATGSKSVTINVSIKDLIGTQNINTTNIKEGGAKIRDMIVQVLTGAVNDFQVVAEH